MIEHQTEAIILTKAATDNADAYYMILTPDLGKIRARATSVRKLTSKLAGHLEPGTMGIVRLVQRVPGGPRRLVESLSEKRVSGLRAIKITALADAVSPSDAPDGDFFSAVKSALFDLNCSGERAVLKAAGFDPESAKCVFCGSDKIVYFSEKDIIFLCESCRLKTGQKEEDGVCL